MDKSYIHQIFFNFKIKKSFNKNESSHLNIKSLKKFLFSKILDNIHMNIRNVQLVFEQTLDSPF